VCVCVFFEANPLLLMVVMIGKKKKKEKNALAKKNLSIKLL